MKIMDTSELKKSIKVLCAEDDPDDRLMIKEAWEESLIINELTFVEDGEELMDYLLYKGRYKNAIHKLPNLILLDLNMPKKDGREALKEIKSHPDLKIIPIVVLTTSKAEEDIIKSYNLGVNSFITKPVSFEEFYDVIKTCEKYWFEIVELPRKNS